MSHDYKKLRTENFTFIDTTNLEGVTEQSPASDMTEKLKGELQAIFKKAGKLDAIEKSVKILQETLTGMEGKIAEITASAQASAYRDIKKKVKSVLGPSGPSGRSLSRFP